jgi:hypothetical protein
MGRVERSIGSREEEGGMMSSPLYLKGREPFIDHPGVTNLWFGYFTTWVKLHGQWGSRLVTSVVVVG